MCHRGSKCRKQITLKEEGEETETVDFQNSDSDLLAVGLGLWEDSGLGGEFIDLKKSERKDNRGKDAGHMVGLADEGSFQAR